MNMMQRNGYIGFDPPITQRRYYMITTTDYINECYNRLDYLVGLQIEKINKTKWHK